MEHVIIGILIVLCAMLAGLAIKNSNSASEWRALYETERAGRSLTIDDLERSQKRYEAERNAHTGTKSLLPQTKLDLAGARNDLKGLTTDYGTLADENKRLYADKEQLNAVLEKQAKRLEKYEPKKTAPVKKVPAKAVAKKKAHGQHELA
jgi:regulator of replication initiation timing